VKESGLRIRLDPELRREFIEACRQEDQTAAQVIRSFMRGYIAERRDRMQTDLFDGERNARRLG
jgi:hypothetical protein